MGGNANKPPADLIAGAIDWWREAGVDLQFTDDAQPWITQTDENDQADAKPATHSPESAAPEPSEPPAILACRDDWPQSLAEFSAWWLAEPALDQGGTSPRVPPRGPQSAELMVLVPEPEADDRDTLLSGPLGKFINAMLDAMGIAPEAVYVASALPRNTPLADWQGIAAGGMGALTLHHIGLVAPQRLAVFGRNILPLLGHDPAQSPANLQFVNHEGGRVPVIAGWDLAALLARSKARSAFWQRWLEWTDTTQ